MRTTSIAFTFRQDLVLAQRHSIDSKESAEWFLRSIFADQHHWPPIVIAAFAHGLFLAFLCWVADLVIRRFVGDEATVRLTGFALLVTLYAGLLFFAWPLEDCP